MTDKSLPNRLEKYLDKYKSEIDSKDKSTGFSYNNAVYGDKRRIKSDICFARIKRSFNSSGRTIMYYVLTVNEDLYNYNVLLEDVKDIFAHYLKITVWDIGRDNCIIIEARETKDFENRTIKYAVFMLFMTLIRLIDEESMYYLMEKRFKSFEEWGYNKSTLDTWKDVLIMTHKDIDLRGHNFNNSLGKIDDPDTVDKVAEKLIRVMKNTIGINRSSDLDIPYEKIYRGQSNCMKFLDKVYTNYVNKKGGNV